MYDYHTHSSFSFDSDTPIDDIIRRALGLGLTGVAITDHYEPEHTDTACDPDLDFAGYHAALDEAAKRYAGDIQVAKGIEMGLQPGSPNAHCAAAASAYPYDFIIASIHCADGIAIDLPAYHAGKDYRQAVEVYYADMLRCITEHSDYDVIGHFNVIERYIDAIPKAGEFADQIDVILRKLAEDGKGIEINTSGLRYGMKDPTMPTPAILKRYAELGGEIVTTGSDAHRAQDVGCMLDFAEQMIRDAGLGYLATFKNRRPVMIKL
ncbi:MAG: histidinol-phosphatase HisJ family protein [Clostridiales Family XIII bacterium]|jgi:histidinol-phosphatase (PHP family)|nr:histidinol-phosphatase HisJ family protein [Clostridiales Family XIII bacterium]